MDPKFRDKIIDSGYNDFRTKYSWQNRANSIMQIVSKG
jgi:hypothetical protein